MILLTGEQLGQMPFAATQREEAIKRLDYLIAWAERARAGSEVKDAWDSYLRHAKASRERLASGQAEAPVAQAQRYRKRPEAAQPPSFEEL